MGESSGSVAFGDLTSAARTEDEIAIWVAVYGSAYCIHTMVNKYHADKAAKYASNVADRAVMAARDLAEARK